MDSKLDTYFMAKAIELAEKGRGTTSPNPMVGAVIVKNRPAASGALRDESKTPAAQVRQHGEGVVGQGYHHRDAKSCVSSGADHAEIVALKEAGEAASGATLYVSMEPCCHYGKTPPCTDAIIKSGIKRVVAAMIDDNPVVNGTGMRILKDAGIKTKVGVLEYRARKLNEAYLKYITTGLPFVTVKMATTLDGRIADIQGGSCWITSPDARKRGHEWRAWSDAVMVGADTVLADNPRLTVRNGMPAAPERQRGEAEGPAAPERQRGEADPLRVIVDSTLKTPVDAQVLADSNVLIAATERCDEANAALLGKRAIEVLKFTSREGRVPLSDLIQELGARKLTSVLCEGGATLATALIKERLADKLIFVIAPKLLGSGRNVLDDIGIREIDCALTLNDVEIEVVGPDTIISGYPNYRDWNLQCSPVLLKK